MADFTQPQRRYDLSQALMQQAMAPTRNAGPMEGLAKVLSTYFSAKGMRNAEGQENALAEQEKQAKAHEMNRIMAAAGGAGAAGIPGETFEGGQGPLAKALMTSSNPAFQTAGATHLMRQPKPPTAPKIQSFATGRTNDKGVPMFQDRQFVNGGWQDIASPYPKGSGVTVNTGNQLTELEAKYGKMEPGMMPNPDHDDTKPASRSNPPYIPQPKGSKDPFSGTESKAQLFLDIADKMESSLDAYWEVLQRTGTKILADADKLELSSAYGALQLEYKELAALGVLAGPDMLLIERVLQDPTTLKGNVLEAFGGLEGYKRQLDLVRSKLEKGRASAKRNLLGEEASDGWVDISNMSATELADYLRANGVDPDEVLQQQ